MVSFNFFKKKPKRYYDIHCHFFTKDILTKDGIAYLKIANKINEEIDSSISETKLVGKLFKFFNMVATKDEEDFLTEMLKIYGDNFTVCPLALDLTYCLKNYQPDNQENSFKKKIFDIVSNLTNNKLNILPNIFSKDSTFKQIEDLKRLKKFYPDKILPFFPVDPRQNLDFYKLIKENVGRGKPFAGIKLYPSLGFSPTDPVLFDNGLKSIYAYCSRHGIPIIVHSSRSGLSSLVENIKANGLVYDIKTGELVDVKKINSDGIISYSEKDSEYNIIIDRSLTFNHPDIWKVVLNKFPNLIIDFAHFGGDSQLNKYMESKETGFWVTKLIELMSEYKNVYTDLSCYSDNEKKNYSLKRVKEEVYDKLPKNLKEKVMYGSDWTILSLKETNIKRYFENFKEVFADEFEDIAKINPNNFLKRVL